MEIARRFSSSISISLTVVSVGTLILMLLFIVILILIACKLRPWRRFLSSSDAARHRRCASIKVDDIERPLVEEDLGIAENQSSESVSYTIQGADNQTHGNHCSSYSSNAPLKQSIPSPSSKLPHSCESFVLDIPSTSEDSVFGQTLKRSNTANQFAEDRIYENGDDIFYRSTHGADKDSFRGFDPTHTAYQKSILVLEVISGPSRGVCYSIDSTNTLKLPVTMGRVSPADILLNDSEVSGKHATINWNVNKMKWELVDMGSLNGTFLNSQAVHHHQSGSRHWGKPVDLSSGDTITLGTSSKIFVQIRAETERHVPFGIGIASDPMAIRHGGKKLPMEDVCYYEWPLNGSEQFGVFGICDGHGGADAATCVSKIMPEVISSVLSDSLRDKVISQFDATDVLRESFYQAEARINHYYEGCTATVLLVWADGHENFYAQCANVGDSACVVNIEGKQIKLTEDHRVTSHSERARFQASGAPLRDGETRIGGINLARMLGDKFLKEKDPRFSSEPYISEVIHIHQASNAYALLASDGFWDVVSIKKAIQLVNQKLEESSLIDKDNSAEKIANFLLNEARKLRTKDNTSIIFLDFSIKKRVSSYKPRS